MFNDDGRWRGIQKNRIKEYLSELSLEQLDDVLDYIEDVILKQNQD